MSPKMASEVANPALAGLPHGRLDALAQMDWRCLEESLDANGSAVIPALLSTDECRRLAALYTRDDLFRTRVVMAQHGFGRGEYKYFAYPLPQLLDELRKALYPGLASIGNRWNSQLGVQTQYPDDLDSYLARCRNDGQIRPTSLLLEYHEGCYNRLHQDLYGAQVFPLQLAILLSEPEKDFTGGELVIVENISGKQRADVVSLRQGDGVIFAVNQRPTRGKRGGLRKATMRHGVSLISSGRRHTLGLIFHDSR